MRFPVALVSLVFAAVTGGCAAQTGGANDAYESGETTEQTSTTGFALSGGNTYFRLERKDADGTYVVARQNGGTMRCANGSSAARCNVDTLVLPADCDWECQDGLLSFRGVALLRGVLSSSYDARAGRRVSKLTVAAGFDTFDRDLGRRPVYRVSKQAITCKKAPCPERWHVVKVNASGSVTAHTLDFSQAHDPNYVQDPSRGLAQAARPEGLLVTGALERGVFAVDRVFRQWTPVADCDVMGAAQAYFFQAPDETEVNMVFPTTAEAETYQDPQGRTVHWLVRTENKGTAVAFTGGTNDLWSQTFDVSTTSCAVTLTGEH